MVFSVSSLNIVPAYLLSFFSIPSPLAGTPHTSEHSELSLSSLFSQLLKILDNLIEFSNCVISEVLRIVILQPKKRERERIHS